MIDEVPSVATIVYALETADDPLVLEPLIIFPCSTRLHASLYSHVTPDRVVCPVALSYVEEDQFKRFSVITKTPPGLDSDACMVDIPFAALKLMSALSILICRFSGA